MGLGRWLSRGGAESGSAGDAGDVGVQLLTWDDVQTRATSIGPMNRDSARGLPGVGHGVDLICAVIAPLTPHAIKYLFSPKRPIEVLESSKLLIDPDPAWHGRSTWQAAVVADLMWDGNAFADKEREVDRLGYPTRLPLIAPSRVTWDWSTDDPARARERVYVVMPDPANPWAPTAERVEMETSAMWHAAVCVDAGARMGQGILHRYQDVLRLMAAVERATWVVMRDGKPVGVLSVDADLTEPELKAAKAAFTSGVRADGIAALVRAEFSSVGWNATDLALIPAREYNLRLAADITGVPPYLLGVPSESRVYCVDTETEILTADGWKRYDEVTVGDLALTLDPATMTSEWQPVSAVNVFPGPHQVVRMESESHSSVTTPDHRWPVLPYGDDRMMWTTTGGIQAKDVLAAPRAPSRVWSDGDHVDLVPWDNRAFSPDMIDGPVWCPTTPNGTWLARRGHAVYFTGNSNMETEWSNFIRVAISRYLEPMQDQFSRCLPQGQMVRYDTDDLARPDAATRWQNHKIAREIEAMTIDEIRQEERLGPLPEQEEDAA